MARRDLHDHLSLMCCYDNYLVLLVPVVCAVVLCNASLSQFCYPFSSLMLLLGCRSAI